MVRPSHLQKPNPFEQDCPNKRQEQVSRRLTSDSFTEKRGHDQEKHSCWNEIWQNEFF